MKKCRNPTENELWIFEHEKYNTYKANGKWRVPLKKIQKIWAYSKFLKISIHFYEFLFTYKWQILLLEEKSWVKKIWSRRSGGGNRGKIWNCRVEVKSGWVYILWSCCWQKWYFIRFLAPFMLQLCCYSIWKIVIHMYMHYIHMCIYQYRERM